MAPIALVARAALPESVLELLCPRATQPDASGPAPAPAHPVLAELEARNANPNDPDAHALPLPLRLPVPLLERANIPTGTPPLDATRVLERDGVVQTSTIPSTYSNLYGGPDTGTVVGIVLGSVGGFIIALWMIWACINIGNPEWGEAGTASVVTMRSSKTHMRSRSRHHHSRSHGGGGHRRETVEIRSSRINPGSVIVEERVPVERVVVEERTRSVSRPPMATRIVEDDDEVVVIEENSPPRRHRSRSTRRSMERRPSGGYRDVDPDRFAGGDAPIREIRRSSSRR